MKVHIDYQKRVDRICEKMKSNGIDLLLATRGKNLTYIGGAFIPWRSVMIVGRDGFTGLHTLLMDAERLKDDSWLEHITGCAPLPGMELWQITVDWIKKNGYEKARIGIEMGHSPRMISGFMFASEMQYLNESLPGAKFVNVVELMDQLTYIKDPEEIKILRQAAAIADAAQERIRDSLRIGISEMEIAGIGELEMRRLGSEFHWPVTGSSEIASGHRSWYPMGGCTPPTDKIVQRSESLLIDMHPTYQNYYSDLSHNYILGKPTAEQRKLADAYLQTCETIIAAMKTGSKIGEVCKKVNDVLDKNGYRPYALPGYGHGIGVIGHEWYPAILDSDEFRNVVLEENVVEIAALVLNKPGVGGMRLECPVRVTASGGEQLCKTPLELTILDV